MLSKNNALTLIFSMIIAGLLLTGCGGASDTKPAAGAETAPLFVDAVDVSAIETIPGCEERPYKEPRRYPRCVDPEKLLDAAKGFALENNLPLVILWGFDECPGCADQYRRLFNPDMSPTDKAVSSALTDAQKSEFSNYTKGSNQLALVRLNSSTSLRNVQAFADKIGANDVGRSLGWEKIWSPMFMVMNPETEKLASSQWFNGYEFCSLGEELAEDLERVGIVSANPDGQRACYLPGDATDEDLTSWKQDCAQGDFTKCFWAGETEDIRMADVADDDPAKIEALKASSNKFLARGCENGVITACRSLALAQPRIGTEYTQTAIDLFRKACDQKDMNACHSIARAYQAGHGDLRASQVKAAEISAMACETHDSFACAQLGLMAFHKVAGTRPYQKKAKALLAFGCRDNYKWACDDKYK